MILEIGVGRRVEVVRQETKGSEEISDVWAVNASVWDRETLGWTLMGGTVRCLENRLVDQGWSLINIEEDREKNTEKKWGKLLSRS